MKVSECMTRDVKITSPDQTLQDVAKLMAELDAGILPVGDGDRLVGMITDRDIAVRAIAMGKGPNAKVSEIMSPEVKYCFEHEDIAEVLRNMGDIQVRRLPVLNSQKRLVGIISIGDLATNGAAVMAGNALNGISQPGGEHSQTLH
jgi:CBS domain-containing protein